MIDYMNIVHLALQRLSHSKTINMPTTTLFVQWIQNPFFNPTFQSQALDCRCLMNFKHILEKCT